MPETPFSRHLSCQELVELVTDYLEDALEPDAHARFEAHLEYCPGCEMYLHQMRQTVRALGRLTEESIEPTARDKLLDLFRDWKQTRPGGVEARRSASRG